MNILTVGLHDILLPDSVDAGKLLSLLSKGMGIRRHAEQRSRKLIIEEDPHFRLELRVVAKGTEIIAKDDDGNEKPLVDVVIPRPNRLRLKGGN